MPSCVLPKQLVVALIIFLAAACATQPRRAANTAERNAVIAHHRMLRVRAELQANARQIASGSVQLEDIPTFLRRICDSRCEAAYFQCIEHTSLPTFDIPGSDRRAPKEFPIEIPECTDDPGCAGAEIVSQPEHRSCADARQACRKACECK